jgi:DNA-binding FadR family transcriptional regulator
MIGGIVMKPIKYSLTKQIADELEKKIQSGEYKIGEKIPTEPKLVDYFGVSRNTIRESVQALIHAGLLEARQGDGTYVVATERLQVELFNLLSKTEKQEIQEVRNLLEEYVVVSAALHATEDDIAQIERKLCQRNIASDTVRENTKADLAFHTAIAFATHNRLLINMYQYVSQYFNDFIAEKLAAHTYDQEYVDTLHNELFAAIKNKDSKKAKETISKIIEL